MRTRCHKMTRNEGERGAALVEFALIFPLFMTLILGLFSGGLAYNRKLTLTAAARETTRYGATLPVSPACTAATAGSTDIEKWLNCVANVAVQTSVEELRPGHPERSICVGHVSDTGVSNHLIYTTTNSGTAKTGPCPGAPSTSSTRQVQVVLQRRSDIDALFFDYPVLVRGTSVSRFER